VRQLTAHDSSWDAYFAGMGVQPPMVTYEELAEDHDPVLRRVLDHIGVPPPAGVVVGAPRLSIQADSLSEEWVERYMEHLEAAEPLAPNHSPTEG
jgi:LPS sulfotransferase NodH